MDAQTRRGGRADTHWESVEEELLTHADRGEASAILTSQLSTLMECWSTMSRLDCPAFVEETSSKTSHLGDTNLAFFQPITHHLRQFMAGLF